MKEAVISALVIVFICLSAAGLAVYTVFFTIHRIYLRKLVNLAKKFNELTNGLKSINIFKMQVLASNDIGDKLDLKKYIDIYNKLKDNSVVLRNNVETSKHELNSFNLKVAKKYIQIVDADLNKALADFKELEKAYTSYTQYGETIEATFQNFLEIFEALQAFYDSIDYNANFTRINALFDAVSKTFIAIPKLSIEFAYKKTVETVLDLGKKLRTLADAILLVYRFQVINSYLKTTKEYNEKIITEHYSEIASSDLQALQNLLTIFNHAYSNFNRHYKTLDLGKAKDFAIQAINAINQINLFTYVHINTPALINLSINEIKEQTDKILLNKNEIINSMNDLKQYFVLEPQIIDCFSLIEKDVNRISELSIVANRINYTTHTEKISAVRDLDNIAKQIVKRKIEIVAAIDQIDDLLGKVIKTVTDLNDLYIYFWQLLTFVKQLSPSGSESKGIKELISSNIKQIEEYSQQIITNKNPDFDNIALNLSSIIEQSQQIYKQLTTSMVLKTYASKLLTYVNRYKTNKTLKDDFAVANKLFKEKKYAQSIDQLLLIYKKAKKNKK